MTLRYPKPAKRSPKAPKRIARHVRFAKRSAKRAQVEKWDAAWSAAVRSYWGHQCARCGKGEPLDAHHIKGKKAHPELRHDLDNGVAFCREHHDWAHAHRREFKAWWRLFLCWQ